MSNLSSLKRSFILSTALAATLPVAHADYAKPSNIFHRDTPTPMLTPIKPRPEVYDFNHVARIRVTGQTNDACTVGATFFIIPALDPSATEDPTDLRAHAVMLAKLSDAAQSWWQATVATTPSAMYDGAHPDRIAAALRSTYKSFQQGAKRETSKNWQVNQMAIGRSVCGHQAIEK